MFCHLNRYLFFIPFLFIPFSAYGLKSLPELLGLGKNKPPQSEKSVRSLRARRIKNKKPYQTIKTMSYTQLKEYRDNLLADAQYISPIKGDNPRLAGRRKVCKERRDKRAQLYHKERAIKYTERMVPLCKDLDECGKLMLELADLNFDCGNLEVAQKKYEEFVLLYPGDEKLYHALHQELLCSFYLSLDAERDQEKTHETLKIADTFLTRAQADSNYYDEVLSIKRQCQERLFQHELLVTQFYLKRSSFSSAYTRIKATKDNYQQFMEQSPPAAQQLAQLEDQLIAYVPSFAAALKDTPPAATVVAQVTETPQAPRIPSVMRAE